MAITKTKNPRTYQQGISKSSHKLSDYVVGNLKNVIRERNNEFMEETHTMNEVIVHLRWIFYLSDAFNKDTEFVEWCDTQRMNIISNVEYKPYK